MVRWLVLILLIIAVAPCSARSFKPALPGYRFQFPEDHASHPQFKTEWWYYTGHLTAENGQTFGFELTFFRSATGLEGGVEQGPWALDNIHMAHFAITDLPRERFFHKEMISRPGIQTAGAALERYEVFNRNWSAGLKGKEHVLRAAAKDYSLSLGLVPEKPPVVHGENGVSQKASCAGCASHYYSLTRLSGKGEIKAGGKTIPVKAMAWMDHEFGSNQLTKEQVGWDWFSLQLDDNTEVMLYVMRLKGGRRDVMSSGTLVFKDGCSAHLKDRDFKITATGIWKSKTSGAEYPSGWIVEIPSANIRVDVRPFLADQELASETPGSVTYWEGACAVAGKSAGRSIKGRAYVELTGYDRPFDKRI